MKLSTRQLVLIAVFGTLWGAVEMSLGSVIKAINLPFSGAFMAAVGLLIAMTGRIFVPRRGATVFIGVIATLLKLFSIGSVVVGPIIGIMAEALIAELFLSLFPFREQTSAPQKRTFAEKSPGRRVTVRAFLLFTYWRPVPLGS